MDKLTLKVKKCMSYSVSLSAYPIPVQMNTFIQKFNKNCLNTNALFLRNKINSIGLKTNGVIASLIPTSPQASIYCIDCIPGTNETGPLPLCTFSVMGLSMCSSIFSESSPVRSKSGIVNELSGFPNSVPTVRCRYTSSSWHGHTSHAYCICFVGEH